MDARVGTGPEAIQEFWSSSSEAGQFVESRGQQVKHTDPSGE